MLTPNGMRWHARRCLSLSIDFLLTLLCEFFFQRKKICERMCGIAKKIYKFAMPYAIGENETERMLTERLMPVGVEPLIAIHLDFFNAKKA